MKAVADAIYKAGADGRFVRIEEMLPVTVKDSEEVPSYQVYLVLAWLRELGVLERVGNEGYRLGETNFDTKSLWDQTPERR